MKKIYLFFLVSLILTNLVFGQKNEPNYPHISSGRLETHYSIIIGSMKLITNAENLVKIATLKGYETEIIPFNIKNNLFYRVCVGKYNTLKEANKDINKVKIDLKISNAWILKVPNIVANSPEAQKQEMTKAKEAQKQALTQKHIADSIAKVTKEQEMTKAKESQKQALTQEHIADSIAKVTKEQEMTKAKESQKQALTQKHIADSIAKVTKEQEMTKAKEAQKQALTQKHIADSIAKVTKEQEMTKAKESKNQSKNLAQTSTGGKSMSDSLFQSFNVSFKNFVENLRDYNYSEANKYIHPEKHLFVSYNQESSPSVREFVNFEKFFAVFSVFTSKGSSYDFSLDLDNLLKKTPKLENYPYYNCDKKAYNTSGLIVSEVNGQDSKLVADTKLYYRNMNTELIPVMEQRLQEAENLISVSVICTDNKFIDGLYFATINGKWYLILMDLKITCK